MSYERTITSNGKKYRQLVESVWDKEKKRSRVHVIRHLKGDACLSPVRYQLPGRADAYLSFVSFIAYEFIAAVKWKLDSNRAGITYEDLMNKLSEIQEVVLLSRGSRIFRWTAVPKETEKMVKPFGILSLRT